MSLPFSQRLRPMKGFRYFAPANDAALEGWIRNFRMIYRSQRSLAAPSTRATASISKPKEDRAFRIVTRKCVFTNNKVWFLTLFSILYGISVIDSLNTTPSLHWWIYRDIFIIELFEKLVFVFLLSYNG